jgi:hypothetical protein
MEPNILDDIDGDLAEIEAIERMQRRHRAFAHIRERMKEEGDSGAAIARMLGKSASQINLCLRGDYPWRNAYGLPKYLYHYVIKWGYAQPQDITWVVPAKRI